MFVEPVIGAGGVYPPRPATSRASPSCASETGVLLVIDSVICGFGRLGTWFGIERWGVEPDMITFAKGVTSGYLPLGGVMVSEPHRRAVLARARRSGVPPRRDLLGHATCCAAALANIDLLEREGCLRAAG